MSKKGFTLIELLVVVGIIAILAVIGITLYSRTLQESRDAKRQQDIQSISKALEIHYDTLTGQYPALTPELTSEWFIDPESQSAGIPKDPLDGESDCIGGICKYYFEGVTDFQGGNSYKLCANLESDKVISSGVYCLKNQR